jgi:hypothetical protein
MIYYRPVFYLKHDVSEAAFCLRLQVEPTQVGPTEKGNVCLRTPEKEPVEFMKPTQHNTDNQ